MHTPNNNSQINSLNLSFCCQRQWQCVNAHVFGKWGEEKTCYIHLPAYAIAVLTAWNQSMWRLRCMVVLSVSHGMYNIHSIRAISNLRWTSFGRIQAMYPGPKCLIIIQLVRCILGWFRRPAEEKSYQNIIDYTFFANGNSSPIKLFELTWKKNAKTVRPSAFSMADRTLRYCFL